jgi:hypothetical protein
MPDCDYTKHIFTYRITIIHNIMYSVHDKSLMSHRTRLLSSWLPHGSLVSSTVADQLLILPPIPLPWLDPISLRVHAFTRSLVGYINDTMKVLNIVQCITEMCPKLLYSYSKMRWELLCFHHEDGLQK